MKTKIEFEGWKQRCLFGFASLEKQFPFQFGFDPKPGAGAKIMDRWCQGGNPPACAEAKRPNVPVNGRPFAKGR